MKIIQKMKQYVKIAMSATCNVYYNCKWKKVNGNCLNQSKREEEIVVSLTSFPGRIHIVHKTIQTILMQNKVKPDQVILWLATEQFPNKEKDLPNNLLLLKDFGLQILWCEDIRSYKKLIPTLKLYPKASIITADDDVYYKSDWVEKLFLEHLNDKNNILCNKATKFYLNESGSFCCVSGGKEYYANPSYLNKLVGIGGVLYPSGCFDEEIMREDIFMDICRTNDDIWFWLMGVKNQRKVKVIKNNYPKPIDVFGSQKTEKLTDINDNGEMLFWDQFRKMCRYYPIIEDRLRREYSLYNQNKSL